MDIEPLKAPDSITIRSVTTYAEQIRNSLASTDAVTLDFSDSVELDLSALQLIAAARIFADASGKSVTLAEPARGPLLDLLDRAGFLAELTPTDADFWFHGERAQ